MLFKSKIKLYFATGVGVFFGLGIFFLFLYDPYLPNTPDKAPQSAALGFIFGIIGFLLPYYFSKRRPLRGSNLPRRGFTEEQKTTARHRQNGICLRCRQYPSIWEYHHRDGNRSNNQTSNCEAICPTCHAKIERGLD